MAFQSGAGRGRTQAGLIFQAGAGDPGGSQSGGESPARDLKKVVLIAGLGILSWVATYVGMLELIEANMGELPLIHKAIIAFSVAMLMTMIIWLLDQMFAPIPAFTKIVYAAGYVFLTLISVGFGFGFYWKVLESRSEASRSAESAVAQVQGSLNAAATRLDQLQSTLVKLTAVSSEKAELERTKGTSCPNSRPGDGPRRKLREDDAARFSFASEFVKERANAVKGEMTALDADLLKIANSDPSMVDPKSGTRNEFMKALSRKLDMTVTGFNAFRTDPQLRQLRTELADRAEQSTFGDPKKGGFICPDAQLQGALRGAVKAIDQLPELEKPRIAAVEGSEATIEAFRRLTATFFGALSFKMPPSADELRELQQKAVQSVEGGAGPNVADADTAGLSKRDYVPLAVALFVDLCLLLVSMGRPTNRLGGLMPRMREAERSPVSTILSRFNDIHRDGEIRQTFEVFRHVVFDWSGVYYVAVPLDAPYAMGRRPGAAPGPHATYGSEAAQELQHEAHLLANLFTSFEKERIFARVHSPLLTTRAVQKKLARQGSKFAACRAFRIYRFRDGAWQEIILGAVMGAAKRAEDQRAILARDGEAATARGGLAGRIGVREPERTGLRAEPTRPRQARSAERDPRFVADHGPYAEAARDELTARAPRDAEIEVRAANSNTAPASRPLSPATERSVPAGPPLDPASPTVVTLPVRPRPPVASLTETGLGQQSDMAVQPAERVEPVVETTLATGGGGMVDVVMRRETAAFRVPVSHATLPAALLSVRGGAESGVCSAPVIAVGAAVPLEARPESPAELVQPIAAIARAIEDASADLEDGLDGDGPDDLEDADAEGAARLAGRLRPALPGA
jgi:hypothetical protein